LKEARIARIDSPESTGPIEPFFFFFFFFFNSFRVIFYPIKSRLARGTLPPPLSISAASRACAASSNYGMLSHLRFHRRAPSNPTSPNPDQSAAQWEPSQYAQYPPAAVQDGIVSPEARPPSSSNSTSLPPTLPPIARVTSSDLEVTLDLRDSTSFLHDHDSRPQPPMKSPYGGGSGFLGGVALENYRRGVQHQAAPKPESASNNTMGSSHESLFSSRSRPVPPPINTSAPTRPPPPPIWQNKPSSSFVTPTDLQNQNMTAGATGRRPPGTRLVSEPVLPTTASTDPPRGKKSLPFLKNPMSTLLMRRKTSQNAPDILPLPLGNQLDAPTYDPRIRGTRVHDFSAPRPRRHAPYADAPPPPPPNRNDVQPRSENERQSKPRNQRDESDFVPFDQHQRNKSSASESSHLSGSARANGPALLDTNTTRSERADETINLNQKIPSPPGHPAPPVPPKDTYTPSVRSRLSTGSSQAAVSTEESAVLTGPSPSVRTNKSRISLSARSSRDVLSSVPRHMKSTSSRFSFDMIGAAKQEKLLEERHRQRELEKKTTTEPQAQRDSRFDDFDEDGFDYDAMMDDDGLEERIPGVNADYDFEEDDDYDPDLDPNNDQENFAGFVFQRSGPTSALTSPHSAGMMSTPRDADGKVIGFAMSRDTPLLQASPDSPASYLEHSLQPKLAESLPDAMAGLAIQGLHITRPAQLSNQIAAEKNQELLPVIAPLRVPLDDPDLYFDDGEFADEFENDGTAFDESIFDNNDTDQYGRPIPGLFAQSQSSRSVVQDTSKRVSDTTSHLSAHSPVSDSTAHTSLSVGIQQQLNTLEHDESKNASVVVARDASSPPARVSSFPRTGEEKVAAYQAALAAAAHKAAASGKFRRDSSPSSPADIVLPSTETAEGLPDVSHKDSLVNYEDDVFAPDDMDASYDDFDFDDEAIIAEANASALANDSDGWYGQEFGFYSAPTTHNNHHGGGHSSSSSQGSIQYEYSNGGYFGPAGLPGVSRTISGRMISREPNLTPITERSEYSNRNSIMSLAVPPIGSGASSLHSPGLAQLAMMAESGDDSMSLSALLRLRSRAWGGSQASLVSSREGSPKSERGDLSSPWGPGAGGFLGVHGGGHGRKNSAFSILSQESEADSPSGSPTLTMAVPTISSSPPPPVPAMPSMPPLSRDLSPSPAPPAATTTTTVLSPQFMPPQSQPSPSGFPPVLEDEEIDTTTITANSLHPGLHMRSPDSMNTNSNGMPSKRPGMGHRHKGSADSISYVKEEESGETRWVMERRRTGETGELELLGREVIEGGRI
jgi:hypothetical protein